MRVQTSFVLAGWFIASAVSSEFRTAAIAEFFAIQFSSSPSNQSNVANLSQKSYLDHRGSGRVEA
ncbi:MAG: hypothetical protein KME13_06555 [Myxacorys californica WJT36-NPBG1]|nr:hypothetical protein [Myxacorys californica WJT36-NPBG1]